MAICVHGNVCRAWMNITKTGCPLVATCPNGCPYFESKADIQDAILGEVTINKLCDVVMELAKKQGTSEGD